MKQLLTALLTSSLLAGLICAAPAACADTGAPATKKSTGKKSHSKKSAPAPYELAVPDTDDAGAPIDPKQALVTDYKCDLGATVTIFRNDGDDRYIALQWQKVLTRMQRVGTTTGANRFENKRSGLTWVGIPAKGILLDTKNGHQLANECKDAVQAAPKAVAMDVPVVPKAAVVETSAVPTAVVLENPAVPKAVVAETPSAPAPDRSAPGSTDTAKN